MPSVYALVAELVDAHDSNSCSSECGFDSHPRYNKPQKKWNFKRASKKGARFFFLVSAGILFCGFQAHLEGNIFRKENESHAQIWGSTFFLVSTGILFCGFQAQLKGNICRLANESHLEKFASFLGVREFI